MTLLVLSTAVRHLSCLDLVIITILFTIFQQRLHYGARITAAVDSAFAVDQCE